MAQYLYTAFDNFMHGIRTFVSPIVCNEPDPADDMPPPSIDRYFSAVGERLIRARNRFEREYMGDVHTSA